MFIKAAMKRKMFLVTKHGQTSSVTKHFVALPPCLTLFDRVWKFEIHKKSDQTASDVFDVRCVVRLTGFMKHVWRANAYYDADFGHTQPRCPKSFPKSAVESVFDDLTVIPKYIHLPNSVRVSYQWNVTAVYFHVLISYLDVAIQSVPHRHRIHDPLFCRVCYTLDKLHSCGREEEYITGSNRTVGIQTPDPIVGRERICAKVSVGILIARRTCVRVHQGCL